MERFFSEHVCIDKLLYLQNCNKKMREKTFKSLNLHGLSTEHFLAI